MTCVLSIDDESIISYCRVNDHCEWLWRNLWDDDMPEPFNHCSLLHSTQFGWHFIFACRISIRLTAYCRCLEWNPSLCNAPIDQSISFPWTDGDNRHRMNRIFGVTWVHTTTYFYTRSIVYFYSFWIFFCLMTYVVAHTHGPTGIKIAKVNEFGIL